ncbi:MAG: hypothetical protein AAF328_08995 [Planctomycetota bacterium]
MATPPPSNPDSGPISPNQADPAMDELLDRALAPNALGEWSRSARDQTLAAMLDAVPPHQASSPSSGVAGRIGPAVTGLRWAAGLAAAAVFVLVGAVVAVTLMSGPAGVTTPSPDTIVDATPNQTKPPTHDSNTDSQTPTTRDALALDTPIHNDAEVTLDEELAAQLDAWSAAARGTGLDARFTSDAALASASATSADWWDTDPTADTYSNTLDPDALRQQLDSLQSGPDLVF